MNRALAIAFLWVASTVAFAAAPDGRWEAEAVVRFAGTSTLHDFAGELPSQPFVLVISNRTWSAEAEVASRRMNTGSEGRDRNLHAMMQTNAFPWIHGRVVAAPVPSAGTTNQGTVILRIRGVQAELPVRLSGWQATAEGIRFHAAWELSLREFGLKPPSVLGIIRVGDRVRLEADVTARALDPASDSSSR